MTTINNSENLIEKVGGIEKAKAIVRNAPNEYKSFNTLTKKYWWCEPVMSHDISIKQLRDFIPYFENSDEVTDIRNHVSPSTQVIEHDEQIKCWSCNKYMTKSQHSANDGFCIHCSNEVEAERHG